MINNMIDYQHIISYIDNKIGNINLDTSITRDQIIIGNADWGHTEKDADIIFNGNVDDIQQAINDAKKGSDIIFLPGQYQINKTLKIEKSLNVIGRGQLTELCFLIDDNNKNEFTGIHINTEGFCNISNCTITCNVDNTTTNNEINVKYIKAEFVDNLVLFNLVIKPWESGSKRTNGSP